MRCANLQPPTWRATFATLAATLLAGCGADNPQRSLFPLDEGHRWRYDVKTEWDHNTVEHQPQEISTEAAWTFDDGRAFRRRSADGVEWFLRADDSGVYRIARKTDIEDETVRDQAVLRLFADPVASWRDLPRVTTEWYCHGPGLVKLVREEPANSAFLLGGELTMELLEWK